MAAPNLSAVQQQAVLEPGNLLLVAGPGSGKTTTVACKVGHILATNPQAKVMLGTFSREAAAEIFERIKASVSSEAMKRIVAGTFHSLALRQLKTAGFHSRLLASIENQHLIYRSMRGLNLEISLDEADAAIYRCKIDPAFAANNPLFEQLTQIYQAALHEHGACDFTDILLRANRLMREGTIKPIAATHVLADESQDICMLQFEWLAAHLHSGVSVCAVGDDDQSIYGYRHALGHEGMQRFINLTRAKILYLTDNYRADAEVLAPASRLIDFNKLRIRKVSKAIRPGGRTPSVYKMSDAVSQNRALVDAIAIVCRNNPRPTAPYVFPYAFHVLPGQIAVLARKNSQLGAIERQFIESRVPYFRVGRSIWDDVIPQVMISLLHSLHAKTSVGFEVALGWAKVSHDEIERLKTTTEGNLWQLHERSVRDRVGERTNKVEEFINLSGAWVSKIQAAPAAEKTAISLIYGVTSWMKSVLREDALRKQQAQGTAEPANIEIKEEGLIDTVCDVLVGLKGGLASRLMLTKQERNVELPRVILSTFHAAKGLEWDHVFLVDVMAGSVPNLEIELCSQVAVEEERRVFYVAATRARHSLTIFTRAQQQAISAFIYEMGLLDPPLVVDGKKTARRSSQSITPK